MRFRRHRVALLGAVVFCIITLARFVGPSLVTALTGLTIDSKDIPAFYAYPSVHHWLGTDYLGRDVLLRLLVGGQITLGIGVLSALLGVIMGVGIGLICGYKGGFLDTFLMRSADFLLSFPTLPLYVVLMIVFRPSFWSMIMVFSVFSWMPAARLVRSAVLSLKTQEFVEAARAIGAKSGRIMIYHLLLNCLGPIIITTTLLVGINITTEATLSYLGLGIQDPTPSWGNMMLREDTNFFFVRENGPWLVVYPGLFIFLTVIAVNLMGDGLRDAFDPRQQSWSRRKS
jgi:peptide/nickel transport system permease protein